MTQFNYFLKDCNRLLGKTKWRLITILFSRSFWGLFLYRFERSLFLIFGSSYRYLRIPLIPFFVILQSFSNIDIHYKAIIQGGILVLHPSVGVVISAQSKIGKNLTLTGGNVIGFNKKKKATTFTIGNNCTLGANATIIGPVQLANYIKIGASACVIHDFLEDQSVLVGVPAKNNNL
ncbi:MAG: serine O-acetyltransferase [Flavobacteriales bacterium]